MKSGRIKPRGRWCVKRAAGPHIEPKLRATSGMSAIAWSRVSRPSCVTLIAAKVPGRNTARGRGRRIRLGWRLAGWWRVSRLALLRWRIWRGCNCVGGDAYAPAGSAAAHMARAATEPVVMRMLPVGSAAVPCMARTDSRTGRRAAGTDSTDFRSRDCRNSRSTGHRSRYTDRMHSRPAKPRSAPAPAARQCVACHALPQPAGTAEMITWAKA